SERYLACVHRIPRYGGADRPNEHGITAHMGLLLAPFRLFHEYLQPYPARNTVLSFPSQGMDQLNPKDGAKLFQSSRHICLPGFGEFLPTKSTVVGEPHEIPHNPAGPPTGAAARPRSSYGTPKYS